MISNKLFRFSHNGIYNNQFTWASSFLPGSSIHESVCTWCGGVQYYPSGELDVAVEGGSMYPDVLGCGFFPFLVVTERVVDIWHDAQLQKFSTFRVNIVDVIGNAKLKSLNPPKYFLIDISGRCKIDLLASGAKVVNICPKCNRLKTVPPILPGFVMVPTSWDQTQLFRDLEYYPLINFCTPIVFQLAQKFKLTNFRFEYMEQPFDSKFRGIDYL